VTGTDDEASCERRRGVCYLNPRGLRGPICTISSSRSAVRQSPLAFALGSYALTIEIDSSWVNIPPALRLRQYDVVIDKDYGHYAPVRVVSGGFEVPEMAELWAVDFGSRFEWNNFDSGGCDYPEAVAGSPPLYMCGDGNWAMSGTVISGVMRGTAFLDGARPDTACTAPLRFEMRRKP